jgi:2-polyprenyl-3-methyl-5-hydroxy-6-metoxy-1,4-benzoquinol methylase
VAVEPAMVELRDTAAFEVLRNEYNIHNTATPGVAFTRLIIDECQRLQRPIRVLDIGCGRGIQRRTDCQWAVRRHAEEYWGVEPDPTMEFDDDLFDDVARTTLEKAVLPPASFDLAYSFMVMEHVERPEEFMECVARCLKPTGTYLFATPNARHYFTRIASTLRALRLDELTLRVIRRSTAADYHYPVQYRFNSEDKIRRCARQQGFDPPEFAYLEPRGLIEYFPGPTRIVFHILAKKRELIRNPRSLATLICRMRKQP